MIENLLYIILALVGLGILVFIHEFGHFIFAKKVGMRIEVFSIGFGRPIHFWYRDGIKWQICLLPFGGYVKIAGMEKEGALEPYQIKDGFFSKRPAQRIIVALAGPLFNLLFAFLVFLFIFMFGGREKHYSEFSKKIGWLDPQSQLFENQVRPGDEIYFYQNKPFNGFKDLILSSFIKSEKCQIDGFKLNYYDYSKERFSFNLNTFPKATGMGPIYTLGIYSCAGFLINDGSTNEIGYPMKESKIKKLDRLLWANGKILFSQEELSSILNDNAVFLTIKRNDQFLHARLLKVKIDDLSLSKYDQNEIDDWRHDSNIQLNLKTLSFLPYHFDERGMIKNKVQFIDTKLEEEVFKLDPRDPFSIELEKGDMIVAVDGIRTDSAVDILKLLQKKHVLIIVQRDPNIERQISWKDADKEFDKVFQSADLKTLISSIGTSNQIESVNELYLLNPIAPITLEELLTSTNTALAQNIHAQQQYLLDFQKRISKIENKEQREAKLKQLQADKNRKVLGLPILDRSVKYNPSPFVTFYSSLQDMKRTIFSLLTGHLSPKLLAGPVGIVQVMHQSWQSGFFEALFWLGVISLNLGVVNLLPIPVLDGGHILLSFVEMVTRRPIKAKTMQKLIIPFVVLIILAFIFFTYNDLIRIVKMFF